MTGFSPDELSCDAFLGGRLHLLQPRTGYRAGVDPVLLAASVAARAGQSVLELGCGAGAAALCLAARVSGVVLFGVEIQAAYADLARQNAEKNDIRLTVASADLNRLPRSLREEQFDHVIANPPYFRPGAHSQAQDTGRSIALGEQATALTDWIETAARRLKPKGYLHMIQRSDRLPEMLAGCAGRLGSIQVLPLSARLGRAPDLVILRARKEGRSPFRLYAPCVLHDGDRHLRDGDSYTAQITGVLRDASPLEWPMG